MYFQNGLNAESERYGHGIKFISVKDILNNDFITYEAIEGLVDATKKEQETFKVTYGDIVFQRSSEVPSDIGRSNTYLDNTPCLFGGFVIRGHKCGTYHPYFLKTALESPINRKTIIRLGAGAQHYNIGQESIRGAVINLPALAEQEKIAVLFQSLNKRIAVQNKLIEELLTLKKALYNKVFGTDAFNCRDISLHHFMKMPDSVREMHPDRHKLITVRLNEGGVIKNTNVETLKMASTIYYRRSAGQFIYGKQNIFHGAFGIVPCHLDGYASSGDVPALDFKEGVNSSFLMRSMSFSCYSWEKYASGTGSKRIHEKSLLELQVRMPSSGFVERLEKMFAALEQRIERNRRTLNLYLTQKRYLLSQLFI